MAVIKLTITVDDISAALATFDKIKVYRSTTVEAGPYSEITGVGTRIDLVAGTSVYFYDDVAGAGAYFYKVSYFHSTTLLESSLSAAIQGDVDPLYVSIQDMRDEGVPTTISDDTLLERIRIYQRVIESITRQWFVPREVTWEFDGNGTTLAQFPVPIISVTALYVNDDFSTALVEGTDFELYDGRGESTRDDRRNPRIKLITGETSIFAGTGSVRNRGTVFEVGEKNCRVEGTFGFVEADGCVPAPISYALKKLVVRSARPLWSSGGVAVAGPIIEEETDRHRRKYSDPALSTKAWSPTGTGDREVDAILAMYRAPFAMGAPRTTFRRFVGGTLI